MRPTILKSLILAAASLAPLGLWGCETMQERPVATGAIIGGAAGAATGAAVDDKNRWRGAAIGAGAGAAVGAGTGYVVDKATNGN